MSQKCAKVQYIYKYTNIINTSICSNSRCRTNYDNLFIILEDVFPYTIPSMEETVRALTLECIYCNKSFKLHFSLRYQVIIEMIRLEWITI